MNSAGNAVVAGDTGLLSVVRTWGEMVKFSHSLFALPFAVLATFLAARSATPPAFPTWGQFGLIAWCMVAARSAAMTFNRIADAKIDAANPRTATRPIPRGRISVGAAWLFFTVACIAFGLGCVGFWALDRNVWPMVLALPTLAFLCFYSFTKRFTRWSHLVLGVGIAFAPVAAWIAIQPATLGPPAWLLMLTVATWIAGFDIIYACQDVEFDRKVGLHSLPAKIGIGPALWVSRGLHVVTVAALVMVGFLSNLGGIYFAGVGCVALLLVVEQSLVRPNDLSKVNLAFFTINGIVGVVLGVLGIVDVALHVARS